jgi:hypothetical protein
MWGLRVARIDPNGIPTTLEVDPHSIGEAFGFPLRIGPDSLVDDDTPLSPGNSGHGDATVNRAGVDVG